MAVDGSAPAFTGRILCHIRFVRLACDGRLQRPHFRLWGAVRDEGRTLRGAALVVVLDYAVASASRRGSTQSGRAKWHVYPFGMRSR